MFSPDSFSKKALLAKRAFSLFFLLCLVTGAAVFIGCQSEDDDTFVDDHNLNSGLEGTWLLSGTYPDGYTITINSDGKTGTIEHNPGGFSWQNATIEYVYNFNETSGSLIIKREDGKYSAVFFNDLSAATVRLGDAFDPTPPDYPDPAVDALEEAKTKFGPEHANEWGGADANMASAQTKQPQQ
jgi:hypothetical protein